MISLTTGGKRLTPTQHDAFTAALKISHRMRVNLEILDRNEKVLKELDNPRILSGAVQVDDTADVTRSVSLVCLDPAHKLTFDSSSPAAGAVYADNFFAITYGVHVADGDFWVDVPVFTGPITGFERQGPEVTIEAQGKESLALDPHLVLHGFTVPHGTTVANAIKNVMNRIGERSYSLGMIRGKMNTHRAVTPQESYWKVLQGGDQDAHGHPKPGIMSKASGHVMLFYDGRGRLTAKRRNASSKFTFTGDHLTSQPGFTYDVLAARNHIEVTGGTPKHSKKHYRGSATLPAGHPLSPHSLARHGHARYMTTFYSSDSLKSDHACRAKAKQMLAAVAHQGLEASFTTLVVPHLEEGDPVTMKVDGFSITFPLKSYTIPLTADSDMSVGFAKKIAKPKRRKG